MLRYAITDGALGGNHNTLPLEYASISPSARFAAVRHRLLEQVRRLVFEGVEFVQLREKNLPAGELAQLTRSLLEVMADANGPTRLLINTRADIAAASGAHGVHLGGAPGSMTPEQVRRVFKAAGQPPPFVSKACHTLVDVREARRLGADLILFSPIFGKLADGAEIVPGVGLEKLATACQAAGGVPVLALGGVNSGNAEECVHAGAAGVAGIRLFRI